MNSPSARTAVAAASPPLASLASEFATPMQQLRFHPHQPHWHQNSQSQCGNRCCRMAARRSLMASRRPLPTTAARCSDPQRRLLPLPYSFRPLPLPYCALGLAFGGPASGDSAQSDLGPGSGASLLVSCRALSSMLSSVCPSRKPPAGVAQHPPCQLPNRFTMELENAKAASPPREGPDIGTTLRHCARVDGLGPEHAVLDGRSKC